MTTFKIDIDVDYCEDCGCVHFDWECPLCKEHNSAYWDPEVGMIETCKKCKTEFTIVATNFSTIEVEIRDKETT